MAMLRFALLSGVLAAVAGFAVGWRVHDWRDAAMDVRQAKLAVAAAQRQSAISQSIAVGDQARQDRIRTVTRTIMKEIPRYVPVAADSRYPLPAGFVRLHDAAARGVPPDAAGPSQPDEAASDVTLSRASAVIVGNYGDCRADQQRLSAFQAWARKEGLAN